MSASMWLVLTCGVLWLWLATETGIGSRRRGNTRLVAVVSGLCFVVTWVAWYVRDERPYRQSGVHPGQ